MDNRPLWLTAALVVYCLAFLVQVRCTPAQRPPQEQLSALPLAPDDALADTQTGRKVPLKPFDWQKKPSGKPPRCGPKEMEIYGACYRRAHPDDFAPPCEAPTVEYDSTCYYAIQAPKREPSSVKE